MEADAAAAPDAEPDADEPSGEAQPDSGQVESVPLQDELVRPAGPCSDKPSVLGAECPGVVWCTDKGPCDQTDKICCATALTSDCSVRASCNLEQQLRCDGPEDCRDGKVCCMRDGATLCVGAAECSESLRACHTDEDCTLQRCARGLPGTFGGIPVTYFADWGFCRMAP